MASRSALGLSNARKNGRKRSAVNLDDSLPPPLKKPRSHNIGAKSGFKRKFDDGGGGQIFLPARKKVKNEKLKLRSKKKLLNMVSDHKMRLERSLKHRRNERIRLSKIYKSQLNNKQPNMEISKKRKFVPQLHHIDQDPTIAAKSLKAASDLPRLPGRLLKEKIKCGHCKMNFVTSEAYANHRRYDNLSKRSISLAAYNKNMHEYVLICPLKTCCFNSQNLTEYFNHVKKHDIHARYVYDENLIW